MKWLLVAVLVVLSVPVWSFQQFTGQFVQIAPGTPINDDLLASGGNVTMDGTVNGSAFTAGGTVVVNGPVSGTLAAAGGNVTIGGKQSIVTAAGGQVRVTGMSARNAAIAGGDVTFDRASSVTRDLSVAGGNASVMGKVGRNLKVAGGTVNIDGTVNGDVFASGNNISVGDGAVINGNLDYESANAAQISPGAKIKGKTIHNLPKERRAGLGRLWSVILGFALMFLLGAVLIAVFSRWTREASGRLLERPGWAALWGFISLALTPMAVVIVMVTVIGIPLGIAVLMAYFIAMLVSIIVTAVAVGAFILKDQNIWLHLLLGLLVIYALGALPYLGGLVKFAVLLFGLGAIVMTFRRSHAEAQAQGTV